MSLEIIETISLGIIVTNHFRFGEKRMKDLKARYIQPIIMQHLNHIHRRVLRSKLDSNVEDRFL
jgi:hypothetical protein